MDLNINCNQFLIGTYLHVWFHELPTECMANTEENRNKTCFKKVKFNNQYCKIYFFLKAYPSFIAVEFKHGAHP